MKKILYTGIMLLVAFCALSQSVPKTLSFQGYLTDASENAIHNSSVPMTFTLYSGASPVWGPESHTVDVDNGRYSVILGQGSPPVSLDNVAFDTQYTLEISVDGNVLTPRIPLTSAPYALTVGKVIKGTMIENDASDDSKRAITTNHVKDNAITGAKIVSDPSNDAQRPITTNHIKDSQVTAAKIASNAITSAKIGADQVTIDKIGTAGAGDANKALVTDGSGNPVWSTVTTAMIGTDQVTNAKIGADQVTIDKIGTAGAGDANKALVTDGSGNPLWSTVTTAMIAADQVTTAKIGTAGVTDGNKVLSTNGSGDPSWTSVSTVMIGDDQVTTAKIGTAGAGDANKILATNGSGDPAWTSTITNAQLPTAISQTTVAASDYMRADGGLYVGPAFSDPANNLIVASGSKVGIGTTAAPAYTLEVEQPVGNSNYVMRVNKLNTNSGLVRFDRGATLLGYIYELSGTLHFGPFTGSHLASSEKEIPEGSIVSFSGTLSYLSEQSSEPIYGVKVSSKANDPSVLGVYLGRIKDEKSNHMAVAAVGNGDMWVIDNGKDIQPGDLLITGDIAGHAMVDNGNFGRLNVIARAAQKVNWSEEHQWIEGRKHKRISILFESMVVNNDVKKLEEDVKDLRKEIEALKSLIKN